MSTNHAVNMFHIRPYVVLSIHVSVIGSRLRVCGGNMICLYECLSAKLPITGHDFSHMNGFIAVFKGEGFEVFR